METDHSQTSSNNKRIAKNTAMLYVRTIFVMVVSLFSSRIVLDSLGVDNFGIYNVVGGVVAMLSIVTGALSSSISRYLTFELGRGDIVLLNKIFSTSINILLLISVFVLIVGESLGLWFLNSQMNIPSERMVAANWVLQCAIFSFVLGLLSIPYNAIIIAHERMTIFAYISIFEALSKLAIAYLLYISPADRLIIYALLLLTLSLVIRIIYGVYCARNFSEAHYCYVHDSKLFKDMTSFAGWGFMVNSAFVFNTQGVNILINLFFGVGVNAARGVAVQVESVVTRFVQDFMTALNPQITKTYSQGDYSSMNNLIIRGAKFSAFMFLILSLPILIETDFILHVWLKQVPEHTANFIRLSIIGSMIMCIGNTGYTACMATGRIKNYSIWMTSVGCLVFPLSYLSFKLGAPVEATYIIYIIVYLSLDFVRLWLMRNLLGFPVWLFIKNVFVTLFLVILTASILPLCVYFMMPSSFLRFLLILFLALVSSLSMIWTIGLSITERSFIRQHAVACFHKYR